MLAISALNHTPLFKKNPKEVINIILQAFAKSTIGKNSIDSVRNFIFNVRIELFYF